MEDPLYKPESWVIFNLGDKTFFGQILGGNFSKDTWYYQISNPQSTAYIVKESDISHEIIK